MIIPYGLPYLMLTLVNLMAYMYIYLYAASNMLPLIVVISISHFFSLLAIKLYKMRLEQDFKVILDISSQLEKQNEQKFGV